MADDAGVMCVELVELVTDYLEDALDAPERARVDAHLARCEGCAAYLRGLRAVIAIAGRLRPADLPAELATALRAALRELR